MCLFRALITLVAVSAGLLYVIEAKAHFRLKRNHRALGSANLPSDCLYEGRWFTDGSQVSTREACLQCVCNRGALTCTRRACSRLPDPLPNRCHVLHRKGSCCPELHCPDGVQFLDQAASSRLESEPPVTLSNACVEGGTIYAAGSAMSSSTACEQCFCLGGARRCVRPQCMPTPPECQGQPSPGTCCPQRYYCEMPSTRPPEDKHQYDCQVNEKWVTEGEKINPTEKTNNCSQCFCLRGVVQCQPLACAQPLMDCQPLLRPGECCPHRYHCNHKQGPRTSTSRASIQTLLGSITEIEQEKLYTNKSKITLTTKNSINITPLVSPSNNLITATKVKRKTNETPLIETLLDNNSSTTSKTISKTLSTKAVPMTTTANTKDPTTKETDKTTLEVMPTFKTTISETTTELDKITEQPEGTMRIMINGTINCTAELSSTSIPLNDSFNDTERIAMEAQPRKPLIDTSDLEVTFSPNDIITDRSVGFDENETFTINVTSSLMTNNSLTSKKPATEAVSKLTPVLNEALNSSKKTKGDYDYDYTEPTLPPSLPNLKIIPFVAADAVVDEEPPKVDLTYPSIERNDKFPVYYPNLEPKEPVYPKRKEDVFNPTQYPVFVSKKVPSYPIIGHNDMTSYSNSENDFTGSFNGRVSDTNRGMKSTTSAFDLETPAVNLFSPPQETEGGFVPKDPGLIDDFYSMFSSTPSSPLLSVPHLTTSMHLDITKGDCISSDGRRVLEGASVVMSCKECTCLWGELQCSPRQCTKPPRCTAGAIQDPCCEQLTCNQDNTTTPSVISITKNKTKDVITTSSEAPKTNSPHTFNKPSNHTVVENSSPVDDHNKQVDNNTFSETITTPKTIHTTTKQTNKPISEEEDDEEEFSFDSVLKLFLSEYETTTPAVKTKPTRKPLPTIAPFIPLPPYTPPKVSVNRIDHLILGESAAISTNAPSTTTVTTRPTPTTTKMPTTKMTTTKMTTTKMTTTKIDKDEPSNEVHYTSNEAVKTSSNTGVPGLLKLAGCNIYGRMYRVGRIIAELSTPCQECWCTELGVQCKPLIC